MLLHDARAATRASTPAATSCCSRTRIARAGTATRSTRGSALLDRRWRCGGPGRISSRRPSRRCTRDAPRAEDTDWPQIAALYARPRGASPVAGRGAEPRRRGRDGGRSGRGTRADRSRWRPSSAAITCSTAARADLLRRLDRFGRRARRLRPGPRARHERERAPLPRGPAGRARLGFPVGSSVQSNRPMNGSSAPSTRSLRANSPAWPTPRSTTNQ